MSYARSQSRSVAEQKFKPSSPGCLTYAGEVSYLRPHMNEYVEVIQSRVWFPWSWANSEEWAEYFKTLELDFTSLWQSCLSVDFPIKNICIYSTTILIIYINFLLPLRFVFFFALQTVGNFMYGCDVGAILSLH